MKREVALMDLEFTRQVFRLLTLETAICDFWEFVELNEELTKHFLFDWLLVCSGAFDFVPKLNLQWLTKSLFYGALITQVKLNEVGLSNLKPLQMNFL